MPITDRATFCGSKPSRHAPRFVPSFWTYLTSPTSSFVGTTRSTDVRAGGLSLKGVRSRTGVHTSSSRLGVAVTKNDLLGGLPPFVGVGHDSRAIEAWLDQIGRASCRERV